MSIAEHHAVLNAVWDQADIARVYESVLDSVSKDVFKALVEGDEARAGRIISKALEDVFQDEARAILEAA